MFPTQHLLLEDNRTVAVGARALSILIALTARAGEIVGKGELVRLVWPDTFVEESNLRVHIAGLRKALRDGENGNRYVVNVPGRGYSFVAPLEVRESSATVAALPTGTERSGGLPVSLSRMIGRGSVVEAIRANLPQRRFVTLVGPGGIGKTTVAVAAAHALAPSYQHGVSFIDLAAVSSPLMVPTAVAASLGLAVPSADAIPAVVSFLRHKEMLLVLDNCEHVIEAAASAAEEISSTVPGVHILATSREPLRAAGERVHRLAALESPSPSAGLTAAQAMTFPGIQLFVEHVSATMDDFELSDADAHVAADICRRLDGIALAIELAAARVSAFGMHDLLARLDDRFRILTSGRRTALPRHQTLMATLDWSYDLLPDRERRLLRRIAVFTGEFTVEAAAALCGTEDTAIAAADIADLVAKSLVVADAGATPVRYRLLDTTRLYGLDRLRDENELGDALRAHAEYMARLFAGSEAGCERLPQAEWIATYVSQLDNLRAALNWAKSPDGDPGICVELTIGAVPLWVQLSLMSECREWVEHALGLFADGVPISALARMKLNAARGWALMYAAGRSAETANAWSATLELAEELGETSYRLRALWGIWISHLNKGDFRNALTLAVQLVDLVRDSNDSLDVMLAERVLATTLHYRGDQGEARICMDRMLERYSTLAHQPRVARFQVDQRIPAHYFKARILWLQGFADEARSLCDQNVDEGLSIGHALSFCSVLGQAACPIALFSGDFVAAEHYGAMLLDHTDRHGIRLWHEWACCFNGLVAARQGDTAAGLAMMRASFERAGDTRFLPRYMLLMGEFADCLRGTGDVREGVHIIDALIERCERTEERWYLPEALRVKGDLLVAGGADRADRDARACFSAAIDLARRQDAKSWELRTAISLARLLRRQGQPDPGRSVLQDVLAWFGERAETLDMRTARGLLADGAA